MTKYEYEIEKMPEDYRLEFPPDEAPIVSKTPLTTIFNKRGQEGWIYSGTDPMGNMVFRREIMES